MNDPLSNSDHHIIQLIGFWYKGLWNTNMLAFAIQMMLILVLGYVLASTSFFKRVIVRILKYCTTTSRAAFIVTITTVIITLFNWGLGLVIGAIFARKVGEYTKLRNLSMNYPLVAAAGYSGLLVWHGGISGSAPLKVAEQDHFISLVGRNIPAVDMGQTIFSSMNISVSIVLLIILPIAMYMIGRRGQGSPGLEVIETRIGEDKITPRISGAEKADYSRVFGLGLGISFLIIAIYKASLAGSFSVIDPNCLNFILLGLSLVFCGNIATFLLRIKSAMGAASGILIQFPLYFGIMGIMKYSGLVEVFSGLLINISNETTFPLLTFLSTAIINIFIPSGGGQWIIQGPIIVDAAQNLGVPLSKSVMALAYGDQVTNMIQPFWALPLLGITGLKAKDIIPYTLLLMLIGTIVFISGLLLFS